MKHGPLADQYHHMAQTPHVQVGDGMTMEIPTGQGF
jgi:hypothetical protein